MARTLVRVELVDSSDIFDDRFSSEMTERGFIQTIKGRTTHKALRLPHGTYLIERKTPVEALALTREAARAANVQARIFCVPAGTGVRFGNLAEDDTAPANHA